MAEPGRTVRVRGLPTDIEDDRLKDKLFIHFLRGTNGGGEIDSVIIVKATPVSALITFEDSRVAQRVIHRGRHVLEVDGKKYKLTATELCERLSPDQIILSLSATIDYSLLPGGVTALSNICKDHPDVYVYFTKTEQSCTLSGAYTEIQAILAQLIEQLGGSESAENQESSGPASNGARHLQTAQKIQEADDQRRKPDKQKEKKHIDKPPDEYIPGSVRDLTPGGYSWEDPGQIGVAAALQPPSTSPEDFTLIVDADMFQYLQKRCQEYQKILSQYDVEVVDMTNDGLTTLFLHLGATARNGGHAQECLELARKAIGRLYQENESKIRRAQLPKVILSSKGEVKRAFESLSVSHPQLLLNEDDQNIYIIGSDRDVSEAKQFFLLDHSKVRGKEDEEASDLKLPSYASGSSTNADEGRVRLPPYFPGGYSDERINERLKSKEDESRAEGARRFKLAPQFKDSGIGTLGTRLTDFTSRPNSSPSRIVPHGPMLGRDVLSDAAKFPGESVSRAEAQNTGGDILFNAGHALPSFASMPNKSSLKPELMDTRAKTLKSPVTITQSSLLGSMTPLPPAGLGTTLKRANSFSGTSRKKAQANGPMSQDDSSKPSVRARVRSSSFNAKIDREKQEVHIAELTVSSVLWSHIIEAYKTLVDDLTSDIQMKETSSETSMYLTLVLTGATLSKVSSSQKGLQDLIDSVKSDFSVEELHLSELGISDTTNETLQACCSEVRSRFKKVTIQLLNDSLFLRGPGELCSQIRASVREVFSGALDQTAAKYYSFIPSSSQSTLSSLRMSEDQIPNLQFNGTFAVTGESKKVKSDRVCRGQEWQTTYSSDFSEKDVVNRSTNQPFKREDHVIKEKVKTVEVDGQKTEGLVNHSAAGKDTSVGRSNGVGSPPTCMEKEVIQKDSVGQVDAKTGPSKGSRSGQEASLLACHCGAEGTSLMKTKCGLAMCSKCLDIIHIRCKVCHKTEQKPPGIHGKISTAKLPLSLAGHTKDCAIKIIYKIPDGIQGEGHPFPGKPFQGGVFEAFLPDCEKTRRLLPRLEKAFRQGLTFTVTGGETNAKVTWDCIPHKTSLQGGRSGNGYPDSSFLKRLCEVLTSHGI